MRSHERPIDATDLTPDDKQRFAHIEGREDLFETKLLTIESGKATNADRKILIATRDPGSANTLIPIIEALQEQGNAKFYILTDGRAQEKIQATFATQDITPERMVLDVYETIGTPDLIITDPSTSEQGLETFSGATYNSVPLVLIEDYYASALGYLKAAKERNKSGDNLKIPEVICAMDEEGKKLITDVFPEYADRIVVTGSPYFDAISQENTEKIQEETRHKLGVPKGTTLIAYMSQMEHLGMVEELAKNLSETHSSPIIIFRRHPRDNRSYEEYEEIFQKHGLTPTRSDDFTTAEISAASDIVITGWSTEGLSAIYRRKPTIHITDRELQNIPDEIPNPLPPVKLGASIGLDHTSDLREKLDRLQEPNSVVKTQLFEAMEKYYPGDGGNTQRAVEAIRERTKVAI